MTAEEVEQFQRNACPGERVYSMGQVQHDWRLWERGPGPEPRGMTRTGLVFREVWYCTRCRKIEKRMMPDEPSDS